MRARPEAARRVTAELVDLYKRRARRLRRDACRELWRAMWCSLTRKSKNIASARAVRVDVPSPLVGEGSSAGRHRLIGVRVSLREINFDY